MGVARATYERILKDVDLPVLCCAHLSLLAEHYPGVSADTICAIYSQENQYKVIKSHHIHKANMSAYCSRYVSGEDVLDLSADLDFPPCLLMRRMLELLLKLSKQRVSDVLKDPSQLQDMTDRQSCLESWTTVCTQQQQQQQLPKHARLQLQESNSSDHSQLQQQQQHTIALLQRLQRDVIRCVYADRSYSPYCDMAKSLAGLEFEARLYQQLQEAGIPYWSEQQLRAKGLFKTPDALLQVPICVCCGEGQQWHVVHWIDSKASFGDDRMHSQQLEGQYRTYINRYGPGLVIYWFGFIDGLDNDPEVALLHEFPAPQHIKQLARLTAPAAPATAADTSPLMAVARGASCAEQDGSPAEATPAVVSPGAGQGHAGC